jgi:hypothetical protein
MKKNALLVVVFAMLFACSSSEENNNVEENLQESSALKKEEVKKDYDYFIKRISEDADWMLQVEKQAVELGISTEESLSKNAKFMAKQNGFEEIVPSELEKQMDKIKNNPEWFSQVEKQALERGISLDSMLVRSARYVINNKSN